MSFTASASATAGMLTDTAAAAAASSKPGHIVAAAREKLLQQFSRFRGHDETYAGLVASIAWNIVYNPYEGIITPVFRGAPWSASKPHDCEKRLVEQCQSAREGRRGRGVA